MNYRDLCKEPQKHEDAGQRRVYLVIAVLYLLASVACSGFGGPPPTATPTPPPTATPTPTLTPTPTNAPPVISPHIISKTTVSSNILNEITGVTTVIVISAHDPDGDELTYEWTASNGTVTPDATMPNTAVWERELVGGNPTPGTVTVVVSDGRGGEAAYTFDAK